MIKIGGIAAGAVLLGLVGYGVGIAGQNPRPDRPDRLIRQEASEPARPHDKVAPANPRPGKNLAARDPARKKTHFEGVYSWISGQTTILKILPDGCLVNKGEVVCELDSAALRDNLIDQRITSKSAEANFMYAKLGREDADNALQQYQDELLPREQREVEGEVKVAEAEREVGEEELKLVQGQPGDNPLALKRAKLAIARSNLAMEKSKNRLYILTHSIKEARIKNLVSEVEKARSDELAKQATFELEKSKEAKLERQIANCTVVAPIEGTVVYPRYVSTPRGSASAPAPSPVVPIEEGATVRERQLLFQIIPTATPTPDPDKR